MHSKQKPGLPFNLLNKKPGYKHFWEILGYVPVVLFSVPAPNERFDNGLF